MQDLRQFLVLDDSTETDEVEEVVKQMHEAADEDSSSEDGSKSSSSDGKASYIKICIMLCIAYFTEFA